MKKFKKSEDRVVIGIHGVREVLKVRPKSITQFWLREKYADHPQLKELHLTAQRAEVKIQTQPVGFLDKIASSHQGVIAYSNAQPELDWQRLKSSSHATLVALDEVEDPHNLGAVLRSTWLLGAEAVLVPEHRAAHLTPAVSKVAQGAAEHVPVVGDGPLNNQLKELKRLGFWILGLDGGAKQNIFTFEIPEKVVWVLGSESSGLRKSVAGACDDMVHIPQTTPEATFNVSVATAIVLGETFRQRSG